MKRLRDERHEIARLAAVAYRNDPAWQPYGAFDTTDALALTRTRTYGQVNASVLESRVAQLDGLRQRLLSVRAHADEARSQAESATVDLDARRAAQSTAVKDADTATAAAQTAVVHALGSGAALLGLVVDPHFGADEITKTLAVAQAGQGEPGVLLGRLELPIPGAPLGSPFGLRVDPFTGAGSYHPGVDFEAAASTRIRAAAAGVVVVAGDCGGYGNCVVIDHGSSLATVYAHQSVLLTHVGEHSDAGQVVGLVGSTGQSTGPHLHFELRIHGTPIDPQLALTT
jgi:murein DD-endopeptidase MepM/ murein hydrolase activator NlpD